MLCVDCRKQFRNSWTEQRDKRQSSKRRRVTWKVRPCFFSLPSPRLVSSSQPISVWERAWKQCATVAIVKYDSQRYARRHSTQITLLTATISLPQSRRGRPKSRPTTTREDCESVWCGVSQSPSLQPVVVPAALNVRLRTHS